MRVDTLRSARHLIIASENGANSSGQPRCTNHPRRPTHLADSSAGRRRCRVENLRLQLKLSQDETKISSDREVRGPGRQLAPARAGLRNLSLLAATSKEILYSAHTWRDRPPLIRCAVARSGEHRNSRAMPDWTASRGGVYISGVGHWVGCDMGHSVTSPTLGLRRANSNQRRISSSGAN